MECYESRTVRTRKAHVCDFCLRSIPAGTLMECETGKAEGEFFRRYTCPDCAKLTPGFWEWCDGHDRDYLEYLIEHGIDHPALRLEVG